MHTLDEPIPQYHFQEASIKQEIIIYHGSQQIVEVPMFGIGKKYNDYRQGFYSTENNELAKERASPIRVRLSAL